MKKYEHLNKEEVLKHMEKVNVSLKDIRDELLDDEEVVTKAIELDCISIEFASERLRLDKEMKLLAIKNGLVNAFIEIKDEDINDTKFLVQALNLIIMNNKKEEIELNYINILKNKSFYQAYIQIVKDREFYPKFFTSYQYLKTILAIVENSELENIFNQKSEVLQNKKIKF
jgi:hypothetical protein